MSDFKVTVVDHPAKRLIGMKVRTSMRKAQEDCPALWQAFGPRISEFLPAGGDCKGSYGLSVMITAEDFHYWAAVEAGPVTEVPPGMEAIDIPAGQYATCAVPGLDKLTGAYMFIYGTWLNGQSGYALNEQAPCFEQYPPDWQLTDGFALFMPVKKR